MRSFVPLIAAASLLTLTASAIFQLRAQLALSAARNSTTGYSAKISGANEALGLASLARLSVAERGQARNEWLRLSQLIGAGNDAQLAFTRIERRAALVNATPEGRVLGLCHALSAIEDAMRMDPYSARISVHWASVRQLLGPTDCTVLTNSDDTKAQQVSASAQEQLDAVLRLSQKQARHDPAVLYSTGQILMLAGRGQDARSVFRKVLELSSSLNEGQKRLILSSAQSPEQLKELLPGSVARLIEFLPLLEELSPDLYQQSESQLRGVMIESMAQAGARYESGVQDLSAYQEQLFALYVINKDEYIRRSLDAELGALLSSSGQKPLGDYLSARSQLKRVSMVRALARADSRPMHTSFVDWNSTQAVAFDQFFNSVGFYSAEPASIKHLELVSNSTLLGFDSSRIRLMVSDDNQSWSALSLEQDPKILHMGKRSIIILKPKPSSASYWKLNFASASRDGQVYADLDQLLQAYAG